MVKPYLVNVAASTTLPLLETRARGTPFVVATPLVPHVLERPMVATTPRLMVNKGSPLVGTVHTAIARFGAKRPSPQRRPSPLGAPTLA